jgi:hypothetical protein
MSLNELSYFIENQGFGIRPVWVYETWANKRLSLFLSGLLMVGLSVPLATRFRRGGGLAVGLHPRPAGGAGHRYIKLQLRNSARSRYERYTIHATTRIGRTAP